LTGRVPIAHLTPGSLIFCGQIAPWKAYDWLARTVAFLVAAAGLAISWPLWAVIALAIKLDSRGPVFFTQDRIGMGGRPFRLFKFRTMEERRSAGSQWARDNDHRITRVGRWLRKYRLDELPQLWNILRGEMNFVGPRPHPVDNLVTLVAVARNVAECCAEMPYYSLRTKVPPGLTGWAQVRYGYANNLREEMEKLTYDLYYVKNRSMWLDLRILAETVRLVLSGLRSEGAAVDPPWQTVAGDSSRSAPRVRGEPVVRDEATVPHGPS
jgi:lipopolysaccharide/colanic/teichoic acid biosynthesis glycosyltransferase